MGNKADNYVEPKHGYTGPAIVSFAFIPDSKWNCTKAMIVRWHRKSFKCYVKIGRRLLLMRPNSFLIPAVKAGVQ